MDIKKISHDIFTFRNALISQEKENEKKIDKELSNPKSKNNGEKSNLILKNYNKDSKKIKLDKKLKSLINTKTFTKNTQALSIDQIFFSQDGSTENIEQTRKHTDTTNYYDNLQNFNLRTNNDHKKDYAKLNNIPINNKIVFI